MMDNENQDPLNLEAVDRQIRINRMRQELEEMGGVSFVETKQGKTSSLEMQERFLEHILAFEKGDWTTHLNILASRGDHFAPPDELDDASLSRELWRLIGALAGIRVFLCNTNHLSDRELYAYLWNEGLREEVVDLTHDEDGAWHLDPLGSGSDEDTYLSFKYYADEEWRRQWMEDFPDYEMPPHEDPPYNRDPWLPRRNLPGEFD